MNKKENETQKIAAFLFEVGTARKLARVHRQTLLTDDMSDNIATHTFRVVMIGWFLAKMEGVDPYKVVMMCLTHDMPEIRTNDHNWVHKRYVKVLEELALEEQLGRLPYDDLKKIADEYHKRISKEAIIAKDADLLDQVLLLKEYEWQGNREASIWLRGKNGGKEREDGDTINKQLRLVKTKSAQKIGEAILREDPSNWWTNLWTNKNK